MRGLEAGDFEVREDGRPVEITHFAEIFAGRQVGPAELPAPPEAADPSPESPPQLVLYFDDLHLGPSNRARLVDDLRGFLAGGAVPPQNVLIMRQTRDLFTEAAFGSDLNALDDALARLAEARPLGVETAQDKRLAVEELERLWTEAELRAGSGPQRPGSGLPAPCRWFLPRAMPAVQTFARQGQLRIQTTLDHLTAVASFLAGLPGPKTMLYVSDALETSPGYDLMAYVNGVCPGGHTEVSSFMPTEGLTEPFRRLTRHANTNRVTIYALQAFGLKSSFTRTAESGALDLAGGNPLASAIRTHERDGLAFLAIQTGGRAVFNRNRFGPALSAIGQEMNGYYSLAYEPRHDGDGGEHQIEVKLKGAGLRARHRRGYRDKSANESLEERLESAIHLGMMSNPLAARLGAGTVEVAGKDRFRLSLHVLVPIDKVTFLPTGEGDLAHLTVRVLGRNARNRRLADDARTFRVARPPSDAETLDLLVPLEIGGGPLVLAVGVRDEATQVVSYLSTSLDIQNPG